ncbi:uncharacterized protein LOC131937842 [Physella acuta]|uniref:uncharacterized protein LOC131937842 n=1 Tax=Physella acuta TaxID=109671 RepID=UPI0027DDC40E|nr:uncharacterized protein LOC131937842 [Physella acuta]
MSSSRTEETQALTAMTTAGSEVHLATHVTVTPREVSELVSDDMRVICDLVFIVIIQGLLALFGSVTNIINILVFVKQLVAGSYKASLVTNKRVDSTKLVITTDYRTTITFFQGLKETVTISFLALCLADLGNLLPLFWASVCSNPLFDIKEKADNTLFVPLTSGVPHITFLRCSSWIRVYINFERCLCIVFPLRVKVMFTRRKTTLVIICIYIVMVAFMIQGAVCFKFLPYFDTTRNSTVYKVIITQSSECNLDLSNMMNVTARVILFILDIIFTIIMIHRLLLKSKWRSEKSTGTAKDGSALRDYRLIKMLVLISFIYIATSIPALGYTVLFNVLDSVISNVRMFRNFYSVIWGIVVASEAVGSSFNFFVFYSMSARFKRAFWEIFCVKFGRGYL